MKRKENITRILPLQIVVVIPSFLDNDDSQFVAIFACGLTSSSPKWELTQHTATVQQTEIIIRCIHNVTLLDKWCQNNRRSELFLTSNISELMMNDYLPNWILRSTKFVKWFFGHVFKSGKISLSRAKRQIFFFTAFSVLFTKKLIYYWRSSSWPMICCFNEYQKFILILAWLLHLSDALPNLEASHGISHLSSLIHENNSLFPAGFPKILR